MGAQPQQPKSFTFTTSEQDRVDLFRLAARLDRRPADTIRMLIRRELAQLSRVENEGPHERRAAP